MVWIPSRQPSPNGKPTQHPYDTAPNSNDNIMSDMSSMSMATIETSSFLVETNGPTRKPSSTEMPTQRVHTNSPTSKPSLRENASDSPTTKANSTSPPSQLRASHNYATEKTDDTSPNIAIVAGVGTAIGVLLCCLLCCCKKK